jgi:hypothetical protein
MLFAARLYGVRLDGLFLFPMTFLGGFYGNFITIALIGIFQILDFSYTFMTASALFNYGVEMACASQGQ